MISIAFSVMITYNIINTFIFNYIHYSIQIIALNIIGIVTVRL